MHTDGEARAAAPPLLDCDLVMKGGITSGVIYPPLVSRLTERFRLRNIGGTSAGAIAAAAAAAAQHGRLHGNTAAFAELAALPETLGRPGSRRGRSVLRELFQPAPRTARLFRVLAAAGRRGGPAGNAARLLGALARSFPLTALLAVLPGALLVWVAWREGGALGILALAAALALGLGALLLALLARLVLALLRDLPRNAFGLCTGMPAAPEGPPALTPWLTELLDRLAGRQTGEAPLTFGDLWGVRPAEGASEAFPAEEERQAHLQMTTTCLTLGRPFTLPLVDRRFFFEPAELRRFFPERIVRWMEEHPRRPAQPGDPLAEDGRALVAFPAPADLPLAVAARMSSSFPFLLSAVPLWAVDYSRTAHRRASRGELGDDDEGVREGADAEADPGGASASAAAPLAAERCWFSDGGICSNFPVHFFDQPLPGRPTFGINLRPFHPDHPGEPVFLAARSGGTLEWWTRLRPGLHGVPSFVGALLDTMQSWRDNVQLGVPGYRERVAHVSHHDSEGGLNLDMPAEVITDLGARGREAADRLVDAYGSADPDGAWPRHRWTRFRSTMAVLQRALESLAGSYRANGYEALLTRRPGEPPTNYRFGIDRAADAHDAVTRLLAAIEGWIELDGDVFRERAPRPQPELRITPRV